MIVINDRHKSEPSERANTVPKTEGDCKEDLDEIELYVDELDENGETW